MHVSPRFVVGAAVWAAVGCGTERLRTQLGEALASPLVGPWTSTSTLNSARGFVASATENGYFYAIGGCNGSNCSTDLASVEYAPVNGDGTLGAWTVNPTSLPSGRSSAAAVGYGGYVFVTGGQTAANAVASDVLSAPINADGSLGAWTAQTPLPLGLAFHAVAAFNGFLYVVGGCTKVATSGCSNTGVTNAVEYAQLDASGGISGGWISANPFAVARWELASAASAGYLYVLAGLTPSVADTPDVSMAPIAANGGLGPWTSTTALPTALQGLTTLVGCQGSLFALGGASNTGSAVVSLNSVQVAPVNPDGTVGPWGGTSPLISSRHMFASAYTNGFFEVAAGDSGGTELSDSQYAPCTATGSALSLTPSRAAVAASGSIAFAASGGSGTGYAYSILQNTSSGSINAATGAYVAGGKSGVDIVAAMDSVGQTALASVSVSTIAITPPSATVAPGGTLTFVASGGSGSYIYAITANGSGGTVNALTGAYLAGPLSGVADTVEATDSKGNFAAATVSVASAGADGGAADGAVVDGGPLAGDAGPGDGASGTDGGVSDGGARDASVGPADSGASDAGAVDGSVALTDAGPGDAGETTVPDGGSLGFNVGCGCTVDGSGPPIWLALLAGARLRKAARRRSGRRRTSERAL